MVLLNHPLVLHPRALPGLPRADHGLPAATIRELQAEVDRINRETAAANLRLGEQLRAKASGGRTQRRNLIPRPPAAVSFVPPSAASARRFGEDIGAAFWMPEKYATFKGWSIREATHEQLTAGIGRGPAPTQRWAGCFQYQENRIYVRADLAGRDRAFTVAHECGHGLWPGASEAICDGFAEGFLAGAERRPA